MKKFPRLGNYPYKSSKKELIEYLDGLLDWCVEAEKIVVNHVMEENK
jgi:hypothetical protein